jgi:Glu-tRNA(Gln) amidotransferase subunit E-like FAD-binding protein
MANKVIKVTAKQLQSIIAEEASRYKKVLELQRKKEQILSQLNEMYEAQELAEIGIDEGLFGKSAEEKAAELKQNTDRLNALYDSDFNDFVKAVPANTKARESFRPIAQEKKPAMVQEAIKRIGNLGAKAGEAHFIFAIKDRKLIIGFDVPNKFALGAGGYAATTE